MSKLTAAEVVKKYNKNTDNVSAAKKTIIKNEKVASDNTSDLPENKRMDYRVKAEDENVEERKRAIAFRKVRELLLQNVGKNNNYTFFQYTKELIKKYIANPYTNQYQIREVSRYLYRISTLYKKLVQYMALMPLYTYNVTVKTDILKEADYEKVMREYQKVIKRLNAIDIPKEFQDMMIYLIRDGVYYGYVYNFKEDGGFVQVLDDKYCRIAGKNENGQWIVYFDASYFSIGNNKIYVERDETLPDSELDGRWDTPFIEGWEAYKNDKKNRRWFMLPPEKTICAIASDSSEVFMPMPYFSGIMIPLLDVLDYEQLTADRAILENYVLLVSKIPLIDSDRVDDFAVSLDIIRETQELINSVIPDLVGAVYSPMDIEAVKFDRSNSTNDVNMISDSINNVFAQSGAAQLVVSSGSSTNAVGLKLAIANDMSITFYLLEKLVSNFNYFIKRNISEHITFKIHQQTWYNKEEYIQEKKDAATLGAPAMDYLTSLGLTAFEAWNQLRFENLSGIKDLMIPLRNSYSTSFRPDGTIDANTTKRSGGVYDPTPNNGGGRPLEDEVSEKGEEARDEGRVEGVM